MSTPEQRRWHRGARVARLKDSRGYGWVLLLIVFAFVFSLTAPDGSKERGFLVLLEFGTLVLVLWTSGLSRSIGVAACFGVAGIVVAVASLLIDGQTMAGCIWVMNVALVLAIMVSLGVGIADQREVNRQSVTGAICVYILIGILFTFVYGAAATFGSGPFFAQGTDGTSAIRTYFSYVTIATLGYGDYTPAGNFGHAAAVAEALLGQLYLVTVVALLVANIGREKRAGRS